MNLFYLPETDPKSAEFVLSKEESLHAVQVLRMKEGDAIFFTDGRGKFYQGIISSAQVKKCSGSIVRVIDDPSPRDFSLTVAIAPTKSSDRFEWFLEKATEIGCDEIVPVSCEHSERLIIKTERLNKVLVSALKQCLKSRLPRLREMIPFRSFIESVKGEHQQKFIGHIPELSETEFPPKNPSGKFLQSLVKRGEKVIVAIGPEGGFSEREVASSLESGFVPISLGNSRLRVETAGVVACSLVNAVNI